MISREKNLAKMGANSDDPVLQSMARIENQNNAALVGRLDQLGAANAPMPSGTSARVIFAAQDFMGRKQSTIDNLYKAARDLNGGDIPLNTKGGASALVKELEETGKLPALNGVGAEILNAINSGVPITIGRAEGMKTALAAEMRKAAQANDGNAKYALKRLYDVLESAEPAVALGDDVMAAFRRARDANRSFRGLVENTPALKAIEDGIHPDKFFEQFIIGNGPKGYLSNVSSLKKAIAAEPEVEEMLRKSIVDHLKQKALGTTDNFSQSSFNRALDEIGDAKLRLFLGDEATNQLRQLGRAAKALQAQPKGTAVNNSNSGALVAAQTNNLLNRIAESRLVSMLPFGIGPTVRGVAQSGANVQKADAIRAEAELLMNPLRSTNVSLPQLMNSDDLVRRILPVTAAGGAFAPVALTASP